MIPVVIRHRAEADVKKARDWYARDDQRRGARFAEEFALTVDRISALPDQFPEVGKGPDVLLPIESHLGGEPEKPNLKSMTRLYERAV
jgi:plasmid stabilization system protein ParE